MHLHVLSKETCASVLLREREKKKFLFNFQNVWCRKKGARERQRIRGKHDEEINMHESRREGEARGGEKKKL